MLRHRPAADAADSVFHVPRPSSSPVPELDDGDDVATSSPRPSRADGGRALRFDTADAVDAPPLGGRSSPVPMRVPFLDVHDVDDELNSDEDIFSDEHRVP